MFLSQLTRKYGAWATLTVLALAPINAHADPPVPLAYVLSDLGAVPGTTGNSFGFGVNDQGQVTGGGVFDTSGGPTTAFLSGPNGASPLKPLEGLPGGFGYEGGVGINAAGQVTGWDYTAGGDPRAFLSDPNGGALHDLGTLPGTTGSRGSAVNDSGQVVGVADTATAVQAFLSEPNGGPLHPLGTTPDGRLAESATGVNARGEVTGLFTTATGMVHAYLSGPNGGALSDLGILPGGRNSVGYGVNASGQVAGWADIANGSNTYPHAFLSGVNGGPLQDLGVPSSPGASSEARAVNDRGQVVGFSRSNGGELRAFIYSGGVMTDLNSVLTPLSSFTRLYAAYSISNDGHITGEGFTSGGDIHAFLLTPIKAAPRITIRAAASAVNGVGQRTITVTATNTGGAVANQFQMTSVLLNGAAPFPPPVSSSPLPTVPVTLSNTPGMNTQLYSFVFKPTPGLRQAILHVVGSYTDPNNQQVDTFTASIRLPLP